MNWILVISSATSAGTIIFMYFNGSKKRWSWLFSLFVNQPLWITLVILTEAWGLIPIQGAMIALCIRGWVKWKNIKS
jgi:hypothetical protein